MSDSIVMIEVVVVAELERHLEAAVERAAGALVADLRNHDQREVAHVGPGRRDGAVGRAVVDEDHVAALPELGPALEVREQARDVRSSLNAGITKTFISTPPGGRGPTGIVWQRILMSHQSDQLVT